MIDYRESNHAAVHSVVMIRVRNTVMEPLSQDEHCFDRRAEMNYRFINSSVMASNLCVVKAKG